MSLTGLIATLLAIAVASLGFGNGTAPVATSTQAVPTLGLPPSRPPAEALPPSTATSAVRSARVLLARDPLVVRATGGQRLVLSHADRWFATDDPAFGVRLEVSVAHAASGVRWLPYLTRSDSRAERSVSLPAREHATPRRARVRLARVSRYWALVDLKDGRVASFLPAYVDGSKPYSLAG